MYPWSVELCGCTNVTQDELQTLRNESSDLVRERDRLKEDISTLETSCSDKSGEIERLNSQLETTNAELKVKTPFENKIIFGTWYLHCKYKWSLN